MTRRTFFLAITTLFLPASATKSRKRIFGGKNYIEIKPTDTAGLKSRYLNQFINYPVQITGWGWIKPGKPEAFIKCN